MSIDNEVFVIYDTKTLQQIHPKRSANFTSKAAASAACTYARRRYPDRDLKIVTLAEYKEMDTMVERTNLMTGKKYMEDVNTPNYCSPSSEAYWSM